MRPPEQAKVLPVFRRIAETGRHPSILRFKKIEDGLWEVKGDRFRFIGAYGARGEFIVAHRARNKQRRFLWQPDIVTAARVLREDAEGRR